MVKASSIVQSNARFASEQHAGDVCVFAGATSGIGASTLERMVSMFQGPTFYVLGRSAKRFSAQLEKLKGLNSSCKITFLECEFALLSDVDAVSKRIADAEQKVDYLYMSPGLIPLNGPQYTKEGLETCFALSYYSRMRLLSNLLPLLRKSPRPRVLSVLNGGKEKAMVNDDIALDHKWSPISVVNHTTTMTSLSFEHLAKSEKQIAFEHASPGFVRTTIFSRLEAPEGSSMLWRIGLASIRGIVFVVMHLFGISEEESGERHAYHMTSDNFGPGSSRIDKDSEIIPSLGVLEKYRGSWPEQIWDHTLSVFDKVFAG